MKLEKIENGNKEKVLDFQNKMNLRLPVDYYNFLVCNDGATVADGFFYIEALKEFLLMDVFYGIGANESINLIEVNNEFKDDIPKSSILIGEEAGGGFILCIIEDHGSNIEERGIYFYDHQYFFDCSNDKSNTYFICKTFKDFMLLLENTKCANK